MKIVIYALLLVFVSLFSYAAGESAGEGQRDVVNERINLTEVRSEPVIPKSEESLPDVIQRVLPSVVGIEAIEGMRSETASLGSGVIVSEKGYIVTNHHVVGDNPYRIDITLYDGSVEKGELCWSDKALDLAVVKVSAPVPYAAQMGEYTSVRVGEDVFAIGNPLSLQFERSVTKGIVSAKNRSITIEDNLSVLHMEDLIQTDASINPGNSGGPLMNKEGHIIGINTVRVSSAEGMGFAIPINICESVIKKLEETGSFETPYLGLYAYTSRAANYLKGGKAAAEGLYVVSLDVNGPSYRSGIRYGDIITEINSVRVYSMIELRRELFKYGTDESIVLTVVSKNAEKKIEVNIAAMDQSSVGENQ